jgi:hypothetical protein
MYDGNLSDPFPTPLKPTKRCDIVYFNIWILLDIYFATNPSQIVYITFKTTPVLNSFQTLLISNLKTNIWIFKCPSPIRSAGITK